MSGPTKAPRRAFAEPKRSSPAALRSGLVPEGDYVQDFPGRSQVTRRVGAPGSFDRTPVSSPPAETSTRAQSRPAVPAAWPSPRTTGPAVDPVCLNSALPRRAGRASAYYRFFGRDCWPQGQLQGWYSAEPAKDAPPLSPRARSDTSATAEARFRTRMTASVSVPALPTPASDDPQQHNPGRPRRCSPGSRCWRTARLPTAVGSRRAWSPRRTGWVSLCATTRSAKRVPSCGGSQ
jgi:hypothetical protein